MRTIDESARRGLNNERRIEEVHVVTINGEAVAAEGKSLAEAARMGAAAGALNAAAFGPMEGNISPETVEAIIRKNT